MRAIYGSSFSWGFTSEIRAHTFSGCCREKKLVVASDDYGRDLTGVQNLKKKHKRLEAELASHEPAIQAVQEAGEKLMDVSNLGVPEIEQVSLSPSFLTATFFFLAV